MVSDEVLLTTYGMLVSSAAGQLRHAWDTLNNINHHAGGDTDPSFIVPDEFMILRDVMGTIDVALIRLNEIASVTNCSPILTARQAGNAGVTPDDAL